MIPWLAWHHHRRGLIGFGAGGFAISFLYGFAFRSAAGTTAESQAAFGRAVALAGRQFTFLIPAPVRPETLGGYEQYKWLSGAIIMMAIWAALAGVGAGRGDEDRGLTEQWLTAGVSRRRLLLGRSAAFALVLVATSLAATIGIAAAAPLVGQDANLGGDLLKAASMAAGFFSCYGLALLIVQLPAERQTGTALGVGAMVLLLVVNGLAGTIASLSWLGAISPFHWLARTTSAAPGGTFDAGGTLGLALAGLLLVLLAVHLFQRRDLGAGVFARSRRESPPRREASRNPLLGTPFTEGLWEQRTGLAAWVLGTLVLGALMLSVTRSVADALFSDPAIGARFQAFGTGNVYAVLLGLTWFGTALLLLAAYAVVQVSRWSTQDQEGRVELLLSAPLSRARLVIERGLEFAVASLLIVTGGYLGLAAGTPTAGLALEPGHVLLASALLWPFALAFGGLGVAVATRWPRIAVPFLAAFAALEYFLGDLAPLFKLPPWMADLSVFHLYGNPVVEGFATGPALLMTAVFLAGFAAALALFRRRDVPGAG